MRTWVLYSVFLLGISCLLFPADTASFQNLGFSPDSRYFMFGQHGIDERSSAPYAELYIVDVPANRFVPSGTKQIRYDRSVGPGNDGRGALYNLLEETVSEKQKYRIDHIHTGRLIYILLDGEQPKERLEFRDFQTGKKYQVTLAQSVRGTGSEIAASFHLLLAVEEASGKTANYTVGLPDYWRKGVKRYRIKQVLLAPNETSMIFVIEKEEANQSGPNIRFMVETIKLLP